MAMNIAIFDIDGTLANTQHRQPLLQGGYKNGDEKWRAFHEASINDTVIPETLHMLRLLSRYMRIVFFTGRSENYREITEAWLRANIRLPWEVDAKIGGEDFHRLAPDDYATIPVYMRKAGDKRSDPEVKEEMLDALIQDTGDSFKIFAVFDDRQSVCKMWNRRGIFCFDVAQGKGDF